jgi:hypothetical protein
MTDGAKLPPSVPLFGLTMSQLALELADQLNVLLPALPIFRF